MNKPDLLDALEKSTPSPVFTTHEQALWLTHHDKWEEAHDLIQDERDALSSLIHGYLHHEEGDHWNGDYWYRKSGYQVPASMAEQWKFIVDQVAQ